MSMEDVGANVDQVRYQRGMCDIVQKWLLTINVISSFWLNKAQHQSLLTRHACFCIPLYFKPHLCVLDSRNFLINEPPPPPTCTIIIIIIIIIFPIFSYFSVIVNAYFWYYFED